jgi:hypothetical protein
MLARKLAATWRRIDRALVVSLLGAIIIVGLACWFLNWASRAPATAPEAKIPTVSIDTSATAQPDSSDYAGVNNAHTWFTEQFLLSAANRRDEKHGVELLRIDGNGTTHIRVIGQNTVLSARPGHFFASAELTPIGFYLEEAFPMTQSAWLVRLERRAVRPDEWMFQLR